MSSGSGSAHQPGGVQRQEPLLPDGDGDGGGSGSLRLHRAARPTAPARRQHRPAERHRCSGAGRVAASSRGLMGIRWSFSPTSAEAPVRTRRVRIIAESTSVDDDPNSLGFSSSFSGSRLPFWQRRRPMTSSKRLQSRPWTRVASGRRRAGRSSGWPMIQTPTDRRTVLKRRRRRTSRWT